MNLERKTGTGSESDEKINNEISEVAGALAILHLKEILEDGGIISIPALGIEIDKNGVVELSPSDEI